MLSESYLQKTYQSMYLVNCFIHFTFCICRNIINFRTKESGKCHLQNQQQINWLETSSMILIFLLVSCFCGETTPKDEFPRLYFISSCHNYKVADMVKGLGPSMNWDLWFRWNYFDCDSTRSLCQAFWRVRLLGSRTD